MSKSYAKAKGRGQLRSTFSALPHCLLDCSDFRNLSSTSKVMLIACARLFNGRNNGDLSMPLAYLKKWGIKSSATATQCKKELIGADLLICTRDPTRDRKNPHGQCALFALSWLPIDECGGKHEYQPTITALRKFQVSNLVK